MDIRLVGTEYPIITANAFLVDLFAAEKHIAIMELIN